MSDQYDLADRVRRFVADERGAPLSDIHPASRLEEDLGMTGSDAIDFLEVFAARFGVDLSALDFHKHFMPEGCNPLWFVWTPAWLKEHGNYPVTVDHLVRVSEAGHWFLPPCAVPEADA